MEGSALAGEVEVRFTSGPSAVAAAAREAEDRGLRAVCGWPFLSARAAEAVADLREVRGLPGGAAALHVAGGPHPTAAPRDVLAAGFDLVVPGEGERSLLALLGRVARGEDPRAGRGIAWLEGGVLVRAPREAPVVLDEHPAFSNVRGRAGPIEITRGCVHACAYCQTSSVLGARLRHRSLAAVAEAVRALSDRGMRDVRFVTPSALSYGAEGEEARPDAVGALLEAARAAGGPRARLFLGTFPSELRPEHATPASLALLRRHVANEKLLLGAQSGSDRMLAALRRGHGAEHVRAAVRYALEAGFRPEVDFIVGLPGEDDEDRAATRRLVAWCADQGARVHGHIFMPLPGTSLADAPPGRPDPDTVALLASLEGRGAAFGQWRRQGAS